MDPENLSPELIAWTLNRVNAAVDIVARPAKYFRRAGEEGIISRSLELLTFFGPGFRHVAFGPAGDVRISPLTWRAPLVG